MGVAGPWVLRVGLGLGALALLLQGLRGWLACKRYEFQPAEIAELARHHAGMWGWGETGSGTEKGEGVGKGAAVGEWGREVLVREGSGMGRASAPMGSPVGSQQEPARYWDRAAITSGSCSSWCQGWALGLSVPYILLHQLGRQWGWDWKSSVLLQVGLPKAKPGPHG